MFVLIIMFLNGLMRLTRIRSFYGYRNPEVSCQGIPGNRCWKRYTAASLISPCCQRLSICLF